jgi:hypothetical protein
MKVVNGSEDCGEEGNFSLGYDYYGSLFARHSWHQPEEFRPFNFA